MVIARPLVVGLACAALTACSHGSRKSSPPPATGYTPAEVRRAFGAAGLQLVPESLPMTDSRVRALFGFEGGVAVGVYRGAAAPRYVLVLGNDTYSSSRNVVVTYPMHSRFLPRITRALAALQRLRSHSA